MSFVENSSQQLSLFDMLAFLSERKQRMLENTWAKVFSDQIFTKINEHIFPHYTVKSATHGPTLLLTFWLAH